MIVLMKKRTITVNVVILAGGKFRKNVGDTTPISFIKAYGFYFRMGEILGKKTKA